MDSTIGYGLAAFFLAEQSKRRRSCACVLTTRSDAADFGHLFQSSLPASHWATDAIGGFLMGAAWLALTLGLTQAWRNTETR